MTTAALEAEKDAAARAAAEAVADGMRVGLGTGSTVAYLFPALARRGLRSVRYVATSPRTAAAAAVVGIEVEEFGSIDSLDLAIDGADQIAPDGWLVKGGGGAHTREKVVAGAAERFVVIGDSTKPVAGLAGPIPLELLVFGLAAIQSCLGGLAGASVLPRPGTPLSPDGGVIADLHVAGVTDPDRLARLLGAVPGVVEHGLFPPALVAAVIIGRGGESGHAEEMRLER